MGWRLTGVNHTHTDKLAWSQIRTGYPADTHEPASPTDGDPHVWIVYSSQPTADLEQPTGIEVDVEIF
jgi:hypothetical protein